MPQLSRWLWLLLFALTACGPASQPVSVEQTAQDGAPALERKAHLANLGALRWHVDQTRGDKIKVAVLDSGFRDYRQFLDKALPASVKTKSFRKDRNFEARDSQHGILCAEVIHAVAPEAEILLVNWEPDSPQSFLDAVRWAKSEGAKVLSCSLIMPSWSDGEGNGEVHRGLQPLLDDMLFFASAGNTAQRHWCGHYTPNKADWHQWRHEVVDNLLTPWGKERVAVEIYGPTQCPFEVTIWNRATNACIGRSVLQADATKRAGRAVVRFEPDDGATYKVRVRSLDADAKLDAFHLVVLGGSLEHTTSQGSIPFPGDGANVLAVGAVDGENRRVYYSSCGPNSRLPKPDFVAHVPFPSVCRDKPFAGTSAAAPQAAGIAALMWSQRMDASAAQVVRAMKNAALDLGPPGHDHETGYGLIRLPR